jgi:hypothetical protein
MIKIINGKRLNTETAICVGEYTTGSGALELTEKLFRTKKGDWFLYCSGGAMTKYAATIKNSKYKNFLFGDKAGGEGIILLTSILAVQWLEKNDMYEVVEKFFL